MASRRMFPNDPPTITFTKDLRQIVHGDLLPGRTVTILYDAERLPNERSEHQGQKAWTIKAYYKFIEQGEVSAIDLWSETGTVLSKVTDDLGEGTMITGRIDLPQDVDHVTLWFLNTGQSGEQYWDSNHGKNYLFRFVVEDLLFDLVEISPAADGASSSFRIAVAALPEVKDLAVVYSIVNDSAAASEQQRLPLTPAAEPDSNQRRTWTGATLVSATAVIRFEIHYSAYGNGHADTNSGKGYLTWSGAKADPEAGVL